MQNCLTLIRQKNWSIGLLSCRANIIRIDRRNLLKLINKHLGKHIISIFIHNFISLHYYYLIVTFYIIRNALKLAYSNVDILKNSGGGPRTTRFKFKKLKKFRGEPLTTHFKVSGREGGHV